MDLDPWSIQGFTPPKVTLDCDVFPQEGHLVLKKGELRLTIQQEDLSIALPLVKFLHTLNAQELREIVRMLSEADKRLRES